MFRVGSVMSSKLTCRYRPLCYAPAEFRAGWRCLNGSVNKFQRDAETQDFNRNTTLRRLHPVSPCATVVDARSRVHSRCMADQVAAEDSYSEHTLPRGHAGNSGTFAPRTSMHMKMFRFTLHIYVLLVTKLEGTTAKLLSSQKIKKYLPAEDSFRVTLDRR